eukprot:m.187353 g.187353  ORF g.187353 m.187353 type:complete len:1053 (-) comp17044_c0_seq1:101-3259(-)
MLTSRFFQSSLVVVMATRLCVAHVVDARTQVPVTTAHAHLHASCNGAAFPRNLSGTECWGLSGRTTDPMGHPIDSADGCLATCCADPTCTLWNYNPTPPDPPACWVWTEPSMPSVCHAVKGWVGGGGRNLPPPPPPAPPGAPHTVTLPDAVAPATPLPFHFDPSAATSPTQGTVAADSYSLLLNGKRIYPVSGEIHLARVPQSQWREQLLRMRGGGLNMIAVYVFWIHHEEAQGEFNFTGRRNIREFLQIAKELDLHVLMRVGPWDHGECRNGGHPDWVLTKCGTLRSTDPTYLNCTHNWYAALAEQLQGLYWKDGGPIMAVQVDNETSDWKYLLALRSLALSLGITPAFFTKTGWPSPAAGYPSDYPMLPFFGGYADDFWSNGMSAQWHPSSYMFTSSPSLSLDTLPDLDSVDSVNDNVNNNVNNVNNNANNVNPINDHGARSNRRSVGWTVPAGYPWLDVEIGGGMAAAYNHRVHMDPDDMPSMHLCDVGDGVNQMGYYMYHGGNNPHSLVYTNNRDAPETTLQESSFQPAGAQNPMPSISYDFFAPLGEFGQPRPHYHRMRRLHLFLETWGPLVASTVPMPPAPIPADNTSLRWTVRSQGIAPDAASFIFVNNYQRLSTLSDKTLVRFTLAPAVNATGAAIAVPSVKSSPLHIPNGVWFVWPANVALAPNVVLRWATAQLVTSLDNDDARVGDARALGNHSDRHPSASFPSTTTPSLTVFLTQTLSSSNTEIGLRLTGGATLKSTTGNMTVEGADIVIRNIDASHTAFATVVSPNGYTVQLVMLTATDADRAYTGTLAGKKRLFIGNHDSSLVLANDSTLHWRADPTDKTSDTTDSPSTNVVNVFPPTLQLTTASGQPVPSVTDGVFQSFTLPAAPTPDVTVDVKLTTPAASPRAIPIDSASHKPREPNATEWEAAAVYTLTLHIPPSLSPNVEVRLAVNYSGDAARVYYKNRLLTDNWFSGYGDEGGCEVGLSYLAGENPGLLDNGTELTLLVLPLQKRTLETQIWLQPQLWPDFNNGNGSDAVALRVHTVYPRYLMYTDLTATSTSD